MIFLPTEKLEEGMILAQDVRIFEPIDLLLIRKGQRLTDKLIGRLRLFDLAGVCVCGGSDEKLRIEKPVIDHQTKVKTLRSTENIFNAALDPEKMPEQQDIVQLQGTVSQIVDSMLERSEMMVNIADLRSYDEYTYHHCLSVSILSVAVGLKLGLDREALKHLGLTAVLHDIGKIMIPLEILNKPSRLTDEEFAIMKTHSALGGEYLMNHRLGDGMLWQSVIGHHEKVDGSGYPCGLASPQIPFFSKIISVADVYDALTSKRPYRSPMQPMEAAEYLMGNCGTFFDYDIVTAFIHKVDFYPVGSCVELSNGKKYVVVENENALRPVVRSMDKPYEKLDLYQDRSTWNLTIVRA